MIANVTPAIGAMTGQLGLVPAPLAMANPFHVGAAAVPMIMFLLALLMLVLTTQYQRSKPSSGGSPGGGIQRPEGLAGRFPHGTRSPAQAPALAHATSR